MRPNMNTLKTKSQKLKALDTLYSSKENKKTKQKNHNL